MNDSLCPVDDFSEDGKMLRRRRGGEAELCRERGRALPEKGKTGGIGRPSRFSGSLIAGAEGRKEGKVGRSIII